MSSEPDMPPAPVAASASAAPAGPAAVPTRLHVDGLAEALTALRETLDGQRVAGRYGWISGRLMVLRNLVIATAVLSAVLIGSTLLLREAWRQTLTITAFDVPASVADRGLTGEVLARHLFNELLKRRRTITSFDAGQLTSLSSERHSDVATADGRFSLQSVFRALRALTGSETTISGEMLLDGEQISVTARVSGKPQRTVSGPLQSWPQLLGELANYVFESTQPVLLAGYLGETARTPQDLSQLSQLIQRMHDSTPPSPDAALARAYHAYGEALMRQGDKAAALLAWAQARSFDTNFWRPYWSAATALWWDDAAAADKLVREALRLGSTEISRERLLHLRFNLATNRYDCNEMGQILQQVEGLVRPGDPSWSLSRSSFLFACEYRQAEAVALARAQTQLHPNLAAAWQMLALAQWVRPDGQYLAEAQAVFAQRVAADTQGKDDLSRFNLAEVSAERGQTETAEAQYQAALQIRHADANAQGTLAVLRLHQGRPAEAERAARQVVDAGAGTNPYTLELLARAVAAQGRVDEALLLLREARSRFPTFCPLHDSAGTLLLQAGRQQEALALWSAGIKALPRCDLNYLHAARGLVTLQRPAEARAMVDALLLASPGSDGAALARPLLASLAATMTPSR